MKPKKRTHVIDRKLVRRGFVLTLLTGGWQGGGSYWGSGKALGGWSQVCSCQSGWKVPCWGSGAPYCAIALGSATALGSWPAAWQFCCCGAKITEQYNFIKCIKLFKKNVFTIFYFYIPGQLLGSSATMWQKKLSQLSIFQNNIILEKNTLGEKQVHRCSSLKAKMAQKPQFQHVLN